MTTMSASHLYEITVNSQSTIDKVLSPVEQRTATMQDLLLSVDDRGDDGGIDDARHSGQLVG